MRNRENGFTLIEMSVVLLIVGLLLGSFFAFYTAEHQGRLREQTIKKQQRIAQALTLFAQNYGRLPCPARPNATPRGNPLGFSENYNGTEDATDLPHGVCNVVSERHGIVPYRILGLSEQDVIDGWGNPFTYTVDALSQNIRSGKGWDTSTVDVHNQCRQLNNWVILAASDPADPASAGEYHNLAPIKAIFCCRRNDGADRLRILTSPNGSTDVLATEIQQFPPLNAADFNRTYRYETQPTAANLNFFTFAVISHGQNGAGAYILGSVTQRSTAGAGLSEIDNANPNINYRRDLPLSKAGGNAYFDDIVLWHTNRSMFAELGDSCNRP